MNTHKIKVSMAICLAFSIFSAIACNKATSPPTAPMAGSDSSAAAPASATPAPAPAAEKDIAGNYDVTGTNFDGGGSYKATLVVRPRDDVYQFSWISGTESTPGENRPKLAVANSYDGVGVMTDNRIAVSYTSGSDGKGCGVVLYKVNEKRSIDGKAGYWGVNKAEFETGMATSGGGFDARYSVQGRNVEGIAYSGSLIVKKDGEGYTFDWDTGSTLSGYGILMGGYATASFGGKQCAFVAYEVKPDGTLEGKWGGQGNKSFGTETAKKK